MEWFSPEFFSALAAIVLLDLVLAGDNAILIALAARNLPPALQRRAIIWGSLGAIAVRVLMTLAVVWLLKIPGLMAAGGLALLYIAFKLLAPGTESSHDDVAATSFFGAMKTIIVADALMGLDNVLAVAGAAHGNFALVVLGLLISIPIVIWGSSFVLKLLERFPWVVYLGTAVLVITAVKMIVGEPMISDAIARVPGLEWAAYLLAAGVVASATLYFRRRETEAVVRQSHREESAMPKVVIAVNSSSDAERIAEHVANARAAGGSIEPVVVYLAPGFHRRAARFLSPEERQRAVAEQAAPTLEAIRAALERRGFRPRVEIVRGTPAESLTTFVDRERPGAALIAMTMPLEARLRSRDDLANELRERTGVPVALLPGRAAGWIERMAVPAGVGAAVLALSVD